MRKVTVEAKVKITLVIDDGVEVSEIMDEMDYEMTDTTGNATVRDIEIVDYEVVDSR